MVTISRRKNIGYIQVVTLFIYDIDDRHQLDLETENATLTAESNVRTNFVECKTLQSLNENTQLPEETEFIPPSYPFGLFEAIVLLPRLSASTVHHQFTNLNLLLKVWCLNTAPVLASEHALKLSGCNVLRRYIKRIEGKLASPPKGSFGATQRQLPHLGYQFCL